MDSRHGDPLLDQLVEALLEFDAVRVKRLAAKALEEGVPPLRVIEEGVARGLQEVGRRYEEGELFITHLVAAAEAAHSAIDDVLTPALLRSGREEGKAAARPRVVLATVQGDIHDIGKNIVGAMLFASGFEVIDLGKDVPAEQIVEAVKKHEAPLLGLSTLLSTTLPEIPKVLRVLEEEGMRDKVKVMVGGGAVTAQWAREIGADGYGANAAEAVTLAKRLLGHP